MITCLRGPLWLCVGAGLISAILVYSDAKGEGTKTAKEPEWAITIKHYQNKTTAEYLAQANSIIVGEVRRKESQFLESSQSPVSIVTVYDVDVIDSVRGPLLAAHLQILLGGGEVGGKRHYIDPPVPLLNIGEKVLLILRNPDSLGRYRMSHQNVFRVAISENGADTVSPRPSGVALYDSTSGRLLRSDVLPTLADFVYSIKRKY